MKTVILDNGHGIETAGKRSPIWGDGKQLLEYEFNRDIVKRIKRLCDSNGIDCRLLVPEENDVPLSERVRRALYVYTETKDNCFLISVHANAGGGSGWECYTSKGVTRADKMANILYKHAEKEFAGWKMRKDYADGDPDKEENFYILKNTLCPAVLTENFFMDTEKDCRLIMSEAGRQRIANFHFEAIKEILKINTWY